MEDITSYDCRNPVFRVFFKGKTVAIGTAKDLQVLFNQRHRQLKQKLIKQVAMDEEDQLLLKYQVELEAVYQQQIEGIVAYGEQVLRDTQSTYVRPDDLEEECAWFQPNTAERLEQLKKSKCRYRRYRLKKVLPERLLAAFDTPEQTRFIYPDGYEVEGEYGSLPDYEPAPAIGQRRKRGRIDWDTKMTAVELEHLEKKRKRLGIRPSPLY